MGGNVKQFNQNYFMKLGKISLQVLLSIHLFYNLAIPLLEHIPKRNNCKRPQRDMYKNTCSCFINNDYKLANIKMEFIINSKDLTKFLSGFCKTFPSLKLKMLAFKLTLLTV